MWVPLINIADLFANAAMTGGIIFVYIFLPCQTKLGGAIGVALDVRPSVCSRFVSGTDIWNPWEDLFTFAHQFLPPPPRP